MKFYGIHVLFGRIKNFFHFRTDHTKPPYLRKLKEIPPFTVWEVDGTYVRANISNDFVCSAQHYSLEAIPEKEFWIDKERVPDETNFFISFLLKEFNCRAMGMDPKRASALAARKETSERHKSEKYLGVKNLPKIEILERIHKEKLEIYSNEFIAVWVVDGELVRDFCYSGYTEGGHDYVFSFVPDGEIWLDDDLGQTTERRLILLHELQERVLMASQNMLYTPAHEIANEVEVYCRNHPEELDEYLKKALEQNNKFYKPSSKLQVV